MSSQSYEMQEKEDYSTQPQEVNSSATVSNNPIVLASNPTKKWKRFNVVVAMAIIINFILICGVGIALAIRPPGAIGPPGPSSHSVVYTRWGKSTCPFFFVSDVVFGVV